MSDRLMLGLEDLDEVSEDERYNEELKQPRISQADLAFQRRWNWLKFKGVNWKRKKRKKNAAKKAGTG